MCLSVMPASSIHLWKGPEIIVLVKPVKTLPELRSPHQYKASSVTGMVSSRALLRISFRMHQLPSGARTMFSQVRDSRSLIRRPVYRPNMAMRRRTSYMHGVDINLWISSMVRYGIFVFFIGIPSKKSLRLDSSSLST